MKKTMLLMLFPVLPLLVLLCTKQKSLFSTTSEAASPAVLYGKIGLPESPNTTTTPSPAINHRDNSPISIVEYAMSLMGSPYLYAGITPQGFDCSGFITHVFGQYDIAVPHSSALQAKEGTYIAREEAQKGDLVIFTGTNPEVREPGHVGIVISSPGDTIRFVHASSNGGVKVSKVKGTGYNTRFLQVRRIL